MTSKPQRSATHWVKVVFAWGWWVLLAVMVAPAGGPSGSGNWMQILDVVLGLVILVILRWRHRHPLLIAMIAMLLGLVSGSGGVGALWAFASLGTTRDWKRVGPAVAVLLLVSSPVWAMLSVIRGDVTVEGLEGAPAWIYAIIAYVFWLVPYLLALGIGVYNGARRDLLRSYQDRAKLAEQRRRLEVQSAQEAERNRIAREMHDVVAHRISLVSMQASALSFRDDLSREETKELAGQIQSNARQALDELRSVLGSLRNVDDDGTVAKPQPTLGQLPALLADAREAGQRIDATIEIDLDALPQKLSRHAFRIVQEGLTNARKHAAGTLVTLAIDEHDDGLRILITNPLRVGEASLPGSGQGLIGLGERVQIAGGRFSADTVGDEFKLEAWLPWPSES